MLSLFAVSFTAVSAFASQMSPDEARAAHRAEVKVIKKAQREARADVKNTPRGQANGFWKREAERSGFANIGSPAKILGNLNPVPFFKEKNDRYKARKAAEGVK